MGTMLRNILWIPKGNEYEAILIENILYCESSNYYTIFHIDEGTKTLKTVLSSKGLGEWEKELTPFSFCRIHNKTLVNINHIKKFINRKEGEVILSHDVRLAVSKSKKQYFMLCTGIKEKSPSETT